MKKGFTLIEMIAVIGIIAIMSLFVMPSIMNQISNKKDEISSATENLIFSAAELYFNDNIDSYPKNSGSKYCIKLSILVNRDYLKSPLKDAKTGKEIDLSRKIYVEINNYSEYDNYEILESLNDSKCN